MYFMDRGRLDKEKLDLRSSETLIHCQESQFINCIEVVEASPSSSSSSSSIPKSNEEKATIETKGQSPQNKKCAQTYKFSAISKVEIMI